jgi:Domain of unknown function (DUF4349)
VITDESLRDQLAGVDPAAGEVAPDVLDRVPSESAQAHRPGWRRPSVLLAAAAVAAVALVGLSVVPRFGLGGATTESVPAQSGDMSVAEQAPAAPGTKTDTQSNPATSPTMVRTASLLVGTDDPAAAADRFMQTVTALGGQVTSQTVVTQGGGGSDIPVTTRSETATPLPWFPPGPGIWLTVQVPADEYQQALEAAQATGEVVRMEQSAYDAGAQIADTAARIRALESSLARLRALMDDAQDVSQVIALEDAIASRQAELDGLRAQQRELRAQTSMSEISLTLMDPADAKASVNPLQPSGWAIVGRWAVAILVVLALAVLVYRVARRRR